MPRCATLSARECPCSSSSDRCSSGRSPGPRCASRNGWPGWPASCTNKADTGTSAAAAGDQTGTIDAVGDPETHADADAARERFIEGWLSASLLFCVGPLAILGSLSDGLGRGIDQLTLKSVLDGFAALAFASSFGVGVLLSAVSVGVVQGLWTVLGVVLGSLLPDAHIAALTATGGLLLVGIGLRLLRIRDVPVGDMLPALLFAPLLTQAIIALR